MTSIWVVCILMALIFISSIPMFLCGKGDNFLVKEELRHLYQTERLRILMAALSFFASVFCLSIPFIVKGNFENLLFIMTGGFFILVIVIMILVKTWAKNK